MVHALLHSQHESARPIQDVRGHDKVSASGERCASSSELAGCRGSSASTQDVAAVHHTARAVGRRGFVLNMPRIAWSTLSEERSVATPGVWRSHRTYGKEGGKAELCAEHARDDMVNVRNKRCGHSGCKKVPSYGKEGGKAELCAEHAKGGVVDVRSKSCDHGGCNKRPSYGKEGGKAELCAEHADDGGGCPPQEVWPRRVHQAPVIRGGGWEGTGVCRLRR